MSALQRASFGARNGLDKSFADYALVFRMIACVCVCVCCFVHWSISSAKPNGAYAGSRQSAAKTPGCTDVMRYR